MYDKYSDQLDSAFIVWLSIVYKAKARLTSKHTI